MGLMGTQLRWQKNTNYVFLFLQVRNKSIKKLDQNIHVIYLRKGEEHEV